MYVLFVRKQIDSGSILKLPIEVATKLNERSIKYPVFKYVCVCVCMTLQIYV